MASIFTATFRAATAERTVRTAAQTAIATLRLGTAGVHDAGRSEPLLRRECRAPGGPHRDHCVRER
ncbi:hypothetical protein GCM10010207_81960 [Streptomyces atratus]|nr:hypothetical protein GCM10010207_81960 [Streptomyces atratus]